MVTLKQAILLGCMFLIVGLGKAQIVDAYGLRIGAGFSNQYWEYKVDMISGLSSWRNNKLGPVVYLNAEKKLTQHLSVRPEIGYLQKGFQDDIIITPPGEEEIYTDNKNVILHNLSANIGLKISPFEFLIKPYFIAGIRGDYMMSYKDREIEYQGEIHSLYKYIIDDFNQFTLSGLIGIGFEYQELLYIDFEFNPSLTKNLDNMALAINDRFFGLTIGLNASTLITKKGE